MPFSSTVSWTYIVSDAPGCEFLLNHCKRFFCNSKSEDSFRSRISAVAFWSVFLVFYGCTDNLFGIKEFLLFATIPVVVKDPGVMSGGGCAQSKCLMSCRAHGVHIICLRFETQGICIAALSPVPTAVYSIDIEIRMYTQVDSRSGTLM